MCERHQFVSFVRNSQTKLKTINMKYVVLAILFAGACVAVPQLSGITGAVGGASSGATENVCSTIDGLPDLLNNLKNTLDRVTAALSKFNHFDLITFNSDFRFTFLHRSNHQ